MWRRARRRGHDSLVRRGWDNEKGWERERQGSGGPLGFHTEDATGKRLLYREAEGGLSPGSRGTRAAGRMTGVLAGGTQHDRP